MRLASTKETLDSLRHTVKIDGLKFSTYRAGMSRNSHGPETTTFHADSVFGHFFTDGIMSAAMRQDWDDLVTHLVIGALTQAKGFDPITGAEPGKIIHELPGIPDPKGETIFRTTFNRCDTACWFGIGHHYLWMNTDDTTLLRQHQPNLQAGLRYNLRHMDQRGIFWEDPRYCGDETRTRIRASIWKDGAVPLREDGKPFFPIAYASQQALLARFFRDAADLATVVNLEYSPEELRQIGQLAKDRLFDVFWDAEPGTLVFGIDARGRIRGSYSDGPSTMAHLEPGDIPPVKLDLLVKTAMTTLASRFGFRTAPYPGPFPDDHPDSYQLGPIWPVDQWWADEAGHRHGIPEFISVARGCLAAFKQLGLFPESIRYDERTGKLSWGGFDTQLWSASVPVYFASR